MKAILAILTVLGIDLSSKEWAEKNLPLNKKREIVKDHLYFWHIKNRGIDSAEEERESSLPRARCLPFMAVCWCGFYAAKGKDGLPFRLP